MALRSYEKDGSVVNLGTSRLIDLKQGVEIVPSQQVRMLQLKEAAEAMEKARGEMISMQARQKRDAEKQYRKLKLQLLRDQLATLTEAVKRIVEKKAKNEQLPYSSMEGLPVDSRGRLRRG